MVQFRQILFEQIMEDVVDSWSTFFMGTFQGEIELDKLVLSQVIELITERLL